MSGALILIGGHEDRRGERVVLSALARACSGGPLVLVTAASSEPERYLPMYAEAFRPLGVEVVELRLKDRAAADHATNVALLDRAGAVFITGGGQVRAMRILGGSAVTRRIRARWQDGMTVSGASAGAALLGEWMLGGGANDEAAESDLDVVRGLALLPDALVDQHLVQRGRTPRLIAASTLKGVLGIGVDEDTAAVVRNGVVDVIGAGTVTVVDTSHATGDRGDGGVSVRNAIVCVLTTSDESYPLPARKP